MIQLTDNVWAVEVPNKKRAQITIDPIGPVLRWWTYEGIDDAFELPFGNWRYICTSKEVTEEIAAEMVGNDTYVSFKSPTARLNSLLASKGLPGKYLVFIENLAA